MSLLLALHCVLSPQISFCKSFITEPGSEEVSDTGQPSLIYDYRPRLTTAAHNKNQSVFFNSLAVFLEVLITFLAT